MMTKYDEALFHDGASDDSWDEDEEDEDDDHQWGGGGPEQFSKAALEKLNNNGQQQQNSGTNNTSGNTSGRNNNSNISGEVGGGGKSTNISGQYYDDSQSEFSRSIFGESESNFAGSYVRSRRDSSRTNTTVFETKSAFSSSHQTADQHKHQPNARVLDAAAAVDLSVALCASSVGRLAERSRMMTQRACCGANRVGIAHCLPFETVFQFFELACWHVVASLSTCR